ncbi:MAG: methyltransferase domain-containing protein [Pseudomonadota bacterium]
MLAKVIGALRKSKIPGGIVHTLDYCLQSELNDCSSALDLGCGPSSPLQHCRSIAYSVGVETFLPYLNASKEKSIHSEYVHHSIQDVSFSAKSFDAVIMLEVIEHLPEEEGLKILCKAEKWANKKIIISTPQGFFPMGDVDGNSYQQHLSGWEVQRFRGLGFNKIHGMSGAKCMYLKQNTVHSMQNPNELFANIRFKPKKIFYLLNAIAQIGTYYFPRHAFGLFAVKTLIS